MTHTSSRCWGVIWGLIAVASLAAAVFFALLVGEDEGEQLDSFSDASTETQVVLYVSIVLVGGSIVHTGLTRRCAYWTMDRDCVEDSWDYNTHTHTALSLSLSL